MSQEKVHKTLETLGIAQLDAQVYILLGKRGPQKASDMAKFLKLSKQTTYRAIKTLQSKGIITASLEHPSRFSAVPFERVLDIFLKAKTEEVQQIEQDKKGLLSDWQSIALAEAGDHSPRFTVIEGRAFIYPRLKQMVEDAKSQISIIISVPGLMRVEQFGLFDAAFSHASKTNTKLRFLTELSEENVKAMKLLLGRMPKESIEGRTPELGLRPISRMLIRDDEEAAFFVTPDSGNLSLDAEDLCLWTNSKAIVNSFKAVFEDLWHNSTNITKRIAEIETGKPTAKTYIIANHEDAKKKYDDVVGRAEAEIFLVTSSTGLVDTWRNISQLREKVEEGVSVKIMAPITNDNLEAARRLSECCSVRHVLSSILETTIVDGKHLFQFRHPLFEGEKEDETSHFENIFYTSNSAYVEKTRKMFDEVWKDAVAPSTLTFEQITKPPAPVAPLVPEDEYTVSRKDSAYQKMTIGIEEKPGAITEEYIVNKMINAKRVFPKLPWTEPVYAYGSQASAVIHPPNNLNLPEMLLTFYHFDKKSANGAEDSLVVNLYLETPKGMAFVPAAVVTDNPDSVEGLKIGWAGTPAGQNIHLLKRDELEVQVYGNNLFAGWAVPIPLLPPEHTLPPGGVLIEGYGKLKTATHKVKLPSGVVTVDESAGYDAFVTFFHPDSKYAGPGTDGVIARNTILTTYPPPAPKSI